MELKLFDYDLPEELIATSPLKERDQSRLLVVDQGKISDDNFLNIASHFREGDLLVFNNSKVIPAKLTVRKNIADIDIFLHKQLSPTKWQIFAKPGKKLKIGDQITIYENSSIKIIDKLDDGQIIIEFIADLPVDALLDKIGEMPLPPYIQKHHKPDELDKIKYQTIYAKTSGSVAAPTAGLHFSAHVFNELKNKGVNKAFVTLHVGGGTFLPIKSDNIKNHQMHSEFCEISPENAQLINETKKNGGRVIAVGTTSMRTIESAAHNNLVQPFAGETSIYITPGFDFQIFDMLITNFHLPKSSLIVLASAFAGHQNIMNAYNHAIEKKYRFFSYGDCCLLNRENNV